MINLYYITSNIEKIDVANKYLSPLGISVQQKNHEFVEIQSDKIEAIAEHKAQQAFTLFHHPLLINDAGWSITALNGFPGAYMKQINTWLTAEEILRLMQDKKEREVIYKEVFCYVDKNTIKTFTGTATGKVLETPKGNGNPSWQIFSLSESGKSIAECWQEGIDPVDTYTLWEDIADYFKILNS